MFSINSMGNLLIKCGRDLADSNYRLVIMIFITVKIIFIYTKNNMKYELLYFFCCSYRMRQLILKY